MLEPLSEVTSAPSNCLHTASALHGGSVDQQRRTETLKTHIYPLGDVQSTEIIKTRKKALCDSERPQTEVDRPVFHTLAVVRLQAQSS